MTNPDPNLNYTNAGLRIGDTDPLPDRPVREFISVVASNEWVNDEYKLMVVDVHEHALRAKGGQFFHLLCPSPDGAEVWMRRPMSIYRVNEDSNGSDSSRPVMDNIVYVNTFLPQGTYWLDWQAGGSLASGPYTPPNTINGSATTGNGLWSTNGGVTYAAALDRGTSTQQGFPFVIHGLVGPPPTISHRRRARPVIPGPAQLR